MGRRTITQDSAEKSTSKPARTPEERQRQMINLSMDLVEKRLRAGTATSQETTHFLKLATGRDRLEIEKLQKENELLKAKTEAIKSQEQSSEFYQKVINSLKMYSGNGGDEDDQNLFRTDRD